MDVSAVTLMTAWEFSSQNIVTGAPLRLPRLENYSGQLHDFLQKIAWLAK